LSFGLALVAPAAGFFADAGAVFLAVAFVAIFLSVLAPANGVELSPQEQ